MIVCGNGQTIILTNFGTDDPDIYHGSYVGVQIVGRRLQEEKVLALAEYVVRQLGKPEAT